MTTDRTRRYRTRNLLASVALVAALAAMLGGVGYAVGGRDGLIAAVVSAGVLAAVTQGSSWRFELWLVGAHPVPRGAAPDLHAILDALAERAGLSRPPGLYWVPSPVLQAFSVGTPSRAAVGVTDGLLRSLDARQVTAVLAHELSHVRHRDMRLMALADVMLRSTSAMAFFGWILLWINLPLILLGRAHVPWLAVGILIAAPRMAELLNLALSRTREYDADAGAVELTGDPEGLASALTRLELQQRPLWQRILSPGGDDREPSLLRTHPGTASRVERLRRMTAPEAPSLPGERREVGPPADYPEVDRPRRRAVRYVFGPGRVRPPRRR